MTLRRSDYRTEQIGLRLVHHVAPAVLERLAALRRQQAVCDGWPTKGDSAGRGSGGTSVTESAALEAVDNYDAAIEQITDTIAAIERQVGELARLVIGFDRTPAAGDEKRCGDGQRKYGRTLEWSDDTQCPELAVKEGMCLRHYMRCYRFRIEHHLPVGQFFENGAL